MLHRKPHERIVLHKDGKVWATIEITDCTRAFVRLGVTADRSISIHREELLQEKEGKSG